MKRPFSPSVSLKRKYLTARENYLKKLSEIKSLNTKGKRTIHNTASVLEGLKLQHKFMQSEIKRVERTITLLRNKQKKVDPRLLVRLKKLKKEDGENQSRAKSIKEYFQMELKGE